MKDLDNATAVRPSAAYLLTLGMGCIGLTFTAIGLGGALTGRAGGDPLDAFNRQGIVMFIFSFAVVFSMRLIFWPPVPPGLRQFVRLAISAVMALGIPFALLGLTLAWRLPPTLRDADLAVWFSILAVLCQPFAAVWLAKYRQEGL